MTRSEKRKLKSVPRSKRGRPAGHAGGKRTNPNYKAAIAYVRRDTHKQVMKRIRNANDELPDDAKKSDYSDLVQSLLESWLKSK